MNNKYLVRYLVRYNNRHLCVCSFSEKFDRPLNYIEARKEIYLPIYIELVKNKSKFLSLRERLMDPVGRSEKNTPKKEKIY